MANDECGLVDPDTPTDNKHITITIDQKKFPVLESVMTGKEIKTLAGRPLEYSLVLVMGNLDPVTGGDDKIISSDEQVDVKDAMRFRIANSATFGSIRAQIPELLQRHIRELEDAGHAIEVVVDSEIFVVFKDYKIPARIWNLDAVDLLIISHTTYPNAKMDMFWVNPSIHLKSGATAQSADTVETKIGREWQRFSWHVESWNPGQDNIKTYLDVVNSRLGRNE